MRPVTAHYEIRPVTAHVKARGGIKAHGPVAYVPQHCVLHREDRWWPRGIVGVKNERNILSGENELEEKKSRPRRGRIAENEGNG